MMKQTIRLTESDLHRIVKNTVNRVLKEANLKYDINKDHDDWMAKNKDKRDWDWWEARRNSPEVENELGWHQFNHQDDYSTVYDENPNVFEPEHKATDLWHKAWDKDYDSYYEDQDDINPLRKEFDDKWNDTKNMKKVSKRADSRPLHRKGSLNRSVPESRERIINKAVRESINRIKR